MAKHRIGGSSGSPRAQVTNPELPVRNGDGDTVHHLPHGLPRAQQSRRSTSRGRSLSRRSRGPATIPKGNLFHSEVHGHVAGPSSSNAAPGIAIPRPPAHGPTAPARGPSARGKGRSNPAPPPRIDPNRSWAAVATSATKGYELSYIPPSLDGNKLLVEISDEVLGASDPKWEECLVGYFIGRKLPFKLVESALKHVWGDKLAEILANDDGYFFFHIPDRDFRRSILDGGCFTVAKVPLILQQYTPGLDLQRAKHKAVPIWVRLRHIPYSLWSSMGISALASAIGKPLYVDSRTEKMTMISYARVCVEVTGGTPLPNEIDYKLLDEVRTVKVEYEWKPSYCPTCSTFGHRCPTPPPTAPTVNAQVQDDPPLPPQPQEQPWQVVGNKRAAKASSSVERPPPPPKAVPHQPLSVSSVSEDEESRSGQDGTSIADGIDDDGAGDRVDDEGDDHLDVDPSQVPSSIPAEPPSGRQGRRHSSRSQPVSSTETTTTPRLRVAPRSARNAQNK